MNRPPMFLGLAFGSEKQHRLWIPLFLLAPFMLVIFLLVAPFLLLGFLFLWPFGWGKVLLLVIPLTLIVLWALRGLEIDVNAKSGEKVFISFR